MSHHQYYITTAIDYVNAKPHLGHAYEKIAADVMARFQRLAGKGVFFLTGTDEHGSKVQKSAEDKGVAPKAYTDEICEYFKECWSYLNITYDRFIRTTDTDHYELVEKMWNKLLENGDIEKRSYEGNYCTGCEAFLNKRDLDEDDNCAIHQRPPEKVTEENYFFLLSKYKEPLISHIKANPQFIQPDFRKEEVLKMLEELQDISVSRPKSSVSWGIPVPGDDEQTIYVWIDALSNYITGIGCWSDEEKFNKFWGTSDHPNTTHVIGKDILRFHAIYWPAMLLSAGIPLYEKLFVHGFINLNDNKISKSLGNVVSPQDLGERFELPNTDPIRYYLMTVARFGQDGNFTEEDFKLKVNADLSNNLGNLLNRTLNMLNKYFDGKVPNDRRVERPEGFESMESVVGAIFESYDNFNFLEAAEKILDWADGANKLINDSEPWNLYKNNQIEDLERVMYTVLDTLRQVAIMLTPITPNLSQEIWNQLGYTTPVSSQTWEDVINSPIPKGQAINLQGPILPRLDSEIVGAAAKKK